MTRSRPVIALAVGCLLVLSGCSLPTTADGTGTTPSRDEPSTTLERGAPEGPPNDVQFTRGPGVTLGVNGSGFHYSGSVVADLGDVGDTTFEEVRLCLYDEDWEVVATRDLGTFRAGLQEIPVAVRARTVPERMVVEHEDFRHREVYGGVLVRQDGQYVIGQRADLDAAAVEPGEDCR